ncbi:MAG: hypothetical protein IJ299_01175, partial [Oscillospiraceae bacterium]|nr:hypothetical protein [Oscillospiraceae bacterium]
IGGSVEITVTDDSPLVSAEVIGEDSVEVGFSEKLKAEAYHESGLAADISTCTVTFALENEADAQYLTVSPDGMITGVSEGEANVIATVTTDDGSITSEPFKVTVTPISPKNKIIDFRSSTIGHAHNATIEENDWEINVAQTATYVGAIPSAKLNCAYYALVSQIKNVGNSREADTAIDIMVDYDGWYNINFAGRVQYRGAALANLYMDGNFLGEYCFYGDQEDIGTSYVEGPVARLNSMYLTKGRHTFIIRSMKSASYERQYPSYLTLEYLEGSSGIDNVAITCERRELAIGESEPVSAKALLADGREYVFGLRHGNAEDTQNYVTLSSSDSNVLEIKNGKAYAKAQGEVTVTAKAVIGNAEKESSVTVTVNPDLYLSDFEFAKEQYNVYIGTPVTLEVSAYLSNGRQIENGDLKIEYTSENGEIASISGSTVTAVTEGSTDVTAKVTFGNVTLEKSVPVNVVADGFASVELSAVSKTLKANTGETTLSFKAFNNHGAELPTDDATVEYRSGDDAIASVSESGKVTAKNAGAVKVFADVTLGGITQTGELELTVRNGKANSTYYTESRVANARENIEKYDWARKEKDAAVANADKYLQYVDHIYNNIPAHTIERLQGFVDRDNPLLNCCVYCGTDIAEKTGKYGWNENQLIRLW